MYEVKISKTVWASDPAEKPEDELISIKMALFRKNITLPFVPFPGLTIAGKKWEAETIEAVAWDIEQKSFVCSVENTFVGQDDEREHLSFDDLVNFAIEDGWEKIGHR